MAKNKTKKGKVGKAVAIGAGVAAAGAAAYALLGPNGKKNRAKVKSFVKKVKNNKDVMMVASMVKKAALDVKAKGKGAIKKAKSAAKTSMKKGMSAAKKAMKKGVKKASKK